MLQYGIAIDDVERIVAERQGVSGPDSDMMHTGIRREDCATIGQAGARQIFAVRVKLLKHVGFPTGVVTDADVQDAIFGRRLHGLLEESVDPPPGES
jgi:hypothetical protein